MNINQLKYLVESVKTGSINKAAENLYMTQSSLSTAISTLEKELQLEILQRSPKGITLTPSGEIIYEDCLTILAIIHRWEKLSFLETHKKIDVTISCIPTYYNSFLNQFILDFVLQHPTINIILNEITRINSLNALTSNSIMITCFYPNEKNYFEEMITQKKLQMDILFQDTYCVYVGRSHEYANDTQIDENALLNFPAIIFSDTNLINEPQYKYLKQYQNIKLDKMRNILQMVAQNKGFTLMPRSLQNYYPDIHPLELVPNLKNDTNLIMNCALIYPLKHNLIPVEAYVIESIKNFTKDFHFLS